MDLVQNRCAATFFFVCRVSRGGNSRGQAVMYTLEVRP